MSTPREVTTQTILKLLDKNASPLVEDDGRRFYINEYTGNTLEWEVWDDDTDQVVASGTLTLDVKFLLEEPYGMEG